MHLCPSGKCIYFIVYFKFGSYHSGKTNELSKNFWPSSNVVACFLFGLLFWKKLFIDCLFYFFISFLWSVFSLLYSVYNYGKTN